MMEHEVLDYDEPTLEKLKEMLKEAYAYAQEMLKDIRFANIPRAISTALGEVDGALAEAKAHPNDDPVNKYGLSGGEMVELGDIANKLGSYDLGRKFGNVEEDLEMLSR